MREIVGTWTDEDLSEVVELLPEDDHQALHMVIVLAVALGIHSGFEADELSTALHDAYRTHFRDSIQ
ncbi:hypothetical protein [Pseudorhizobium xiangyangii]|uniref:hypothetical protein n=1 Tax=Pseudorhizobium xiangyangii TaxID=2883104 RepID=UPI001CFFCB7E|nr:hypothetical protein [Neorhizobium xiangyangii]